MSRVGSALAGALLIVVTVGHSPAAADPAIGLSRDGITWTEGLTQPLFATELRWVPGDTRTRTLFVRNQEADDAELVVDVLGTGVDALLETGDLEIAGRADAGPWVTVTGSGTRRIVPPVAADSFRPVRVDIRVGFDPMSRNYSQGLTLDLDFAIRLTRAEAGSDDPGTGSGLRDRRERGGTDSGSGSGDPGEGAWGLLPQTGGPAVWALVAGLVLTGAGSVLASKRRRERDHHV